MRWMRVGCFIEGESGLEVVNKYSLISSNIYAGTKQTNKHKISWKVSPDSMYQQ